MYSFELVYQIMDLIYEIYLSLLN